MKTYALLSKRGTAMGETVLTEAEYTPENIAAAKANAPEDWNGGDFQDVSGNEALATEAVYIHLGPGQVHVVYTDDLDGGTHLQPVGDLVDVGTLINEEGDDMPVTGGQATIDGAAIARFTALLEDIKAGRDTAATGSQAHRLIARLGIHKVPAIHPESALFEAGAANGYYEIVGASYTPATGDTSATAAIDLSTPDQTGCLLTHDYGTGTTTLKWDSEDPSECLMGTTEDADEAINDITKASKSREDLFKDFQAIMLNGSPS